MSEKEKITENEEQRITRGDEMSKDSNETNHLTDFRIFRWFDRLFVAGILITADIVYRAVIGYEQGDYPNYIYYLVFGLITGFLTIEWGGCINSMWVNFIKSISDKDNGEQK